MDPESSFLVCFPKDAVCFVPSDQASFLLFGSCSSSIRSLTSELGLSQQTDLDQLLTEALEPSSDLGASSTISSALFIIYLLHTHTHTPAASVADSSSTTLLLHMFILMLHSFCPHGGGVLGIIYSSFIHQSGRTIDPASPSAAAG